MAVLAVAKSKRALSDNAYVGRAVRTVFSKAARRNARSCKAVDPRVLLLERKLLGQMQVRQGQEVVHVALPLHRGCVRQPRAHRR